MQLNNDISIELIRPKNPLNGAFSDIIVGNSNKVAYKIFKSHLHPTVDTDRGSLESELRRLVFKSEKKAYEIASTDKELIHFIPKYYGTRIVTYIHDENGVDIGKEYLLDCCYSLEFIHGDAEEINLELEHVKSIISIFQSKSINYLKDSKIFFQSYKSKLKFIDFAVNDAYYETEVKWIMEEKL